MSNQRSRKPVKREQPRKDSKSKRVNFDNERESKFEKDVKEDYKRIKNAASNDPAWYAANAELMASAASLPYSVSTGLRTPWTEQEGVPGVFTLYWSPAFGEDQTSILNQASNMVYSDIVHANSRNTRYNSPDLMLVILAGGDVFSALAHGIRAYGLMRQYNQVNSYLPEYLVRSMGFDFQDLKANLSTMWFDLNQLIAQSKQIWIPNRFPLITRRFWLNSNVYTDASTAKAQYYMYVQNQFYVYDETGSSTGGRLVADAEWGMTSDTAGTQKTWAQYVALVQRMISALLESEDRGIMFGDILKAYGEGSLFNIADITADYSVAPVYDQEVLTQIENATAANVYMNSISQDPNTNTLITNWSGAPNTGTAEAPQVGIEYLFPTTQVLNMHTMSIPTPAANMVATRLKTAGMHVTATPDGRSVALRPVFSGSEVVYCFRITTRNWNPTTGVSAPKDYTFQSLVSGDNTTLLSKWASFDWAPWLYVMSSSNFTFSGPNVKNQAIIAQSTCGDEDFYTFIETEVLAKMHTTALYSELGVPGMLK